MKTKSLVVFLLVSFLFSGCSAVMKFIKESPKHKIFIYTEPVMIKKLPARQK